MTGSRIVLDGETYVLVHRRDVLQPVDDTARRELVLACLQDPADRSAARRLVEELTGGIMLGTSDIARELDRLLQSGRVIAVRERGSMQLLDAPRAWDPAWGRGAPIDPGAPDRPVVPPPVGPGAPGGPDEPVVETTWIEVRLVGEDGAPVAGERVAIRFPDGSETQGYLDADGRWRLDGIPAGTYQVAFPDAEGPTHPRGKSPTASDSFFAMRVVGERGESYAGAPVSITLPDGRTVEQALDDRSSLRIDELPSGTCAVTFLGRDGARGWTPSLAPRAGRPAPGDVPSASAGTLVDPVAAPTLGLATGEPHVVVVEAPIAHRMVAGAIEYRPRGVLWLPAPWRAFDPWDVVVAVCGWLRERTDHGAVAVGHHAADEDRRYADLRARALLCLLDGDSEGWVSIAAKDGRVSDTQAFLQYLAGRHGWPTALAAATDTADQPTHDAVESFQREYNARFDAAISEDGVIGTQTLGAIFEVAREDLAKHLELGGESLDSLRWLHDDHRALAGSRDLAAHFAAVDGRGVDLVFLPIGVDVDLTAEPAAIDVYERPKALHDVAVATVDIPGAGTLLLDIDMMGVDPSVHVHTLHLRSVDGSISRDYRLSPNDAAIAHVRFDGLDPTGAYTLTISADDVDGEMTVFEQIAFGTIHEISITPVASPYPDSDETTHTIDDPDFAEDEAE